MEFIAVFLVCLFVLFILVAGLAFGRSPVYQPEPEEVLQLLRGIANRTTSEQAWSLFLHTPITHDPELESLRLRCYQFDQGELEGAVARQGINGYIYDSDSRIFISTLADDLEKKIQEAPLKIDF
ncbi:hypothetical protein [Amphritea balenae]|uniref:Uncharacterized protein n=1 Tax=Amphritea balenae TaxID=452629 RepID=A0A3P1SQZ3_9GAMM|nr:hypothetical protein [Amphritea balenae]RRC99530.1 hypothetical protein EHS89_08455 [Amphritea balenae]GGK77777.1 hypothetical protein GCM10007941_29820 [Amphritea balenae]